MSKNLSEDAARTAPGGSLHPDCSANFMKAKQLEVYAGNTIYAACETAVKMAKQELCKVEFEFNEQKLTATPDTDPTALAKHFMDECERRHAEYIASLEARRSPAALAQPENANPRRRRTRK